MTIYQELSTLANTKYSFKIPKPPGQTDESYLLDLVEMVGTKFTDVEWEALTDESKEWYNSAIRSRNASQAIVNCPGYDGIERERTNWNTEVPTKGQAIEKPKTMPKNPVPPTRKPGVIDAIRRTVVANFSWTNKQVFDSILFQFPSTKLETVAINASDIRKTISIAKELGYWNEQPLGENAKEGGASTSQSSTTQTVTAASPTSS